MNTKIIYFIPPQLFFGDKNDCKVYESLNDFKEIFVQAKHKVTPNTMCFWADIIIIDNKIVKHRNNEAMIDKIITDEQLKTLMDYNSNLAIVKHNKLPSIYVYETHTSNPTTTLAANTNYVIAHGKSLPKKILTKTGKACVYSTIVNDDIHGWDEILKYKESWKNYDYIYRTRKIMCGNIQAIQFKVFKQL